MIAKLTIGTLNEPLTLHLQILQGAFLGGSDDLGRLWKPKFPPIQPKPKHRFPEPHLNTWCRALLEKCAAGGGKPSSFCPHLQQLTHVYAPKHCAPSSQPRDTAAILPFRFHTHTRRQIYKFLFVHQYFYLALKMMISQVAHTQKKRQNWKGGALSRVSKTIWSLLFFNQLFHFWQQRSQVQKWSELPDGCFAVNDMLLEVST